MTHSNENYVEYAAQCAKAVHASLAEAAAWKIEHSESEEHCAQLERLEKAYVSRESSVAMELRESIKMQELWSSHETELAQLREKVKHEHTIESLRQQVSKLDRSSDEDHERAENFEKSSSNLSEAITQVREQRDAAYAGRDGLRRQIIDME